MKASACFGVLLLTTAHAARAEDLAFYDIVPYAPGHEAETAQDIRETHRIAGLDTFLYSVSLDPRGCPAFANVEAAVTSYRKLKAELGDAPVWLGFLLQSILGHWPRVDKEIEPWQRSVNIDGESVRFCVLDERYRDYIRKTAAALAAEAPCFILGDDDIRAHSPKQECFCPLHTAEFNRREGTAFTPDQYRQAVREGQDGKVVSAAGRLSEEIPLTTVRLIREGIDAVDPKIPAGVCMPWCDPWTMAPRARAMAGSGNPVTLRVANGKYSELLPRDLVTCTLQTQAWVDFYGSEIDSMLDESDTCPHTLYARSGRTFAAKLALGVFNGLRGAKLWYVGMRKGTERVPAVHVRVLGENRRRFAALAGALDGSVPLGVRVPILKTDFVWATECLGAYGLPFRGDVSTKAGGPLLLSGAACVGAMTDDDLEETFRGRVFVDGPAAIALAARGFGKDLGCRPVADGRAFNIEVVRADGSRPPIHKHASFPALTEVASGARVFSELHYSAAGAASERTDYVAAGSLCYTNTTGGLTFVSSFSSSDSYTSQNLRRKAWLTAAVRNLDPDFPVVCEIAEPNLTLARKGRDGRTYVLTMNLSCDDLTTVSYSTARPMVRSERLSADGMWKPADATFADGKWTIRETMPYMGFAVLRW